MNDCFTTTGTLRIIDAAANRAAEGLRVVEDYVRFVLDDRHLTKLCKDLRHDLAAAMRDCLGQQSAGEIDRLLARESAADVGATLATPAEQHRANVAAVAAASFHRVQQSLRSLEEFAKIATPAAAILFEQLRYRAYTLQRAVGIAAESCQRLAAARLYVLVDGRESVTAFAELIAALVAAGVHVLQLRDKNLFDRELLARAKLLRELTRGTGTLFVMNDRPDLAALAAADGVHVGQDELSVKDARAIVGPAALVGVSTHSIEQARQAVLDGANYIGVGPTFASRTKSFDRFSGIELLEAVAAEITQPAFAIGGITVENLPQVLATGISRIAVTGAVVYNSDPALAAKKLLSELTT